MRDKGITRYIVKQMLMRIAKGLTTQEGVARIIPIAFPVVTSVFNVRQQLSVPIGLVNRYILDAICQFGPISVKEIQELLGLGEEVIRNTLSELEALDNAVINIDGRYKPSSALLSQLSFEAFTKSVSIFRKFIVNGVEGKLLPFKFWDSHDNFRLRQELSHGYSKCLDEVDQEVPVLTILQSSGDLGTNDIMCWIKAPDQENKRLFGIPEGATDLTSENPLESNAEWVLAFVIVYKDGTSKVVSCINSPLMPKSFATNDYLAFIAQGERFNPKLLFPPSMEDRLKMKIPECAEIVKSDQDNHIYIKIANPDRILTLDYDGEDSSEQKRFLDEMIDGLWWNPYLFTVDFLVPGDLPTAIRICLLRGVRAMRRELRNIDFDPIKPPPFSLHDWWIKWVNEFQEELLNVLIIPPIEQQSFIAEALLVKDISFQEKLEWFLEYNA